MYKLKLGRSVNLGAMEDTPKKLENLGYDSLDLDLALFWKERDKEIKTYELYLESALNAIKNSKLYFNGVHISFGPNWDFSAIEEKNRRQAIALTTEIFKKVNPYKPYCYILHGSFEPIKPDERELHIEALKKSLKELRLLTDSRICVETLPRTCLLNTGAEAVAITDAVDGIDICADVNHFLQEKSETALLEMGERVKTLHISDHDYVNERHWLPMKGKIDWMKLIEALEKTGYSGVFNYEVGSATAEEIKENYDKLFAAYNDRN